MDDRALGAWFGMLKVIGIVVLVVVIYLCVVFLWIQESGIDISKF